MKSKAEVIARVSIHGKRELKSFNEAFAGSILFKHQTKPSIVEKEGLDYVVTLYVKSDFEYGLKLLFTCGQLSQWKDNFSIQQKGAHHA